MRLISGYIAVLLGVYAPHCWFSNPQADTIWSLNESPIVISGKIYVRSSATLTIEPGVNVVFTEPLATIEVFGKH